MNKIIIVGIGILLCSSLDVRSQTFRSEDFTLPHSLCGPTGVGFHFPDQSFPDWKVGTSYGEPTVNNDKLFISHTRYGLWPSIQSVGDGAYIPFNFAAGASYEISWNFDFWQVGKKSRFSTSLTNFNFSKNCSQISGAETIPNGFPGNPSFLLFQETRSNSNDINGPTKYSLNVQSPQKFDEINFNLEDFKNRDELVVYGLNCVNIKMTCPGLEHKKMFSANIGRGAYADRIISVGSSLGSVTSLTTVDNGETAFYASEWIEFVPNTFLLPSEEGAIIAAIVPCNLYTPIVEENIVQISEGVSCESEPPPPPPISKKGASDDSNPLNANSVKGYFKKSEKQNPNFGQNETESFRDSDGLELVKNITAEFSDKVKIYPNPATDLVNIVFASGSLENLELKIYDVSGRSLISQKFESSINGRYSLNVASLQSGMYVVEILQGRYKATGQLIRE